eukprot:scaffold7148_cov67-Phaeocystis_antarctica.AAC.1
MPLPRPVRDSARNSDSPHSVGVVENVTLAGGDSYGATAALGPNTLPLPLSTPPPLSRVSSNSCAAKARGEPWSSSNCAVTCICKPSIVSRLSILRL